MIDKRQGDFEGVQFSIFFAACGFLECALEAVYSLCGSYRMSTTAFEYSSPEILWHGGGNEGGKPDPVYAVDMHPEGVLATAGVDETVPPKGTVRLWRNDVTSIIEADKQQHWDNYMCDLSDHPKGSVNICRFSPDGLMLASASEAQVVIYKVKDAKDWKTLDEETKKTKLERVWLRPGLEEIRDLEWSPDSSYILVASLDNKAEILRIDSKDRASLGLRGHTNWVSQKKHFAYHNHGYHSLSSTHNYLSYYSFF